MWSRPNAGLLHSPAFRTAFERAGLIVYMLEPIMNLMSGDAGRRPWISRAPVAALPWGLFAVVLLTLIACDLNVNPILDEEQWLQSGLATAHHKFLKTGMVTGPLYGLVL